MGPFGTTWGRCRESRAGPTSVGPARRKFRLVCTAVGMRPPQIRPQGSQRVYPASELPSARGHTLVLCLTDLHAPWPHAAIADCVARCSADLGHDGSVPAQHLQASHRDGYCGTPARYASTAEPEILTTKNTASSLTAFKLQRFPCKAPVPNLEHQRERAPFTSDTIGLAQRLTLLLPLTLGARGSNAAGGRFPGPSRRPRTTSTAGSRSPHRT